MHLTLSTASSLHQWSQLPSDITQKIFHGPSKHDKPMRCYVLVYFCGGVVVIVQGLIYSIIKTGLAFPVTPDWASLDRGHQTWCIRDSFNGKSMPWTMVMCQSCYSTQYLIFFFFVSYIDHVDLYLVPMLFTVLLVHLPIGTIFSFIHVCTWKIVLNYLLQLKKRSKLYFPLLCSLYNN